MLEGVAPIALPPRARGAYRFLPPPDVPDLEPNLDVERPPPLWALLPPQPPCFEVPREGEFRFAISTPPLAGIERTNGLSDDSHKAILHHFPFLSNSIPLRCGFILTYSAILTRIKTVRHNSKSHIRVLYFVEGWAWIVPQRGCGTGGSCVSGNTASSVIRG